MDSALIEKKLAFIQTCVRELQELADPERLDIDVRERRFVEHTLQLAIEEALDAASHWVSARRLGEPETNRALFKMLARTMSSTVNWVRRWLRWQDYAIFSSTDIKP